MDSRNGRSRIVMHLEIGTISENDNHPRSVLSEYRIAPDFVHDTTEYCVQNECVRVVRIRYLGRCVPSGVPVRTIAW